MQTNRPLLLFVTDGPIENGPARLRAYQFERLWKTAGFDVEIINNGAGAHQSTGARILSDRIQRSAVVFIQRNLSNDVLKPMSLFNKPYIFDYDDALFYVRSKQILGSYEDPSVRDFLLRRYRRIVRGHEFYSGKRWMLNKAIKSASAVIAGNEFLAEYTRKHNENVYIIPTAVDVSAAPVKTHSLRFPIVVGWVGVAANLLHLHRIGSVLQEISRKFGEKVTFKVVSNGSLSLPQANIVNKRWRLEEEQADVASFDIGIMPLINDTFAQGKCAFKAILCMSQGIPVVVSDVGMNCIAVKHGQTGFVAKSDRDWIDSLSILIEDLAQRQSLGASAREDMEARFSLEAVFPQLLRVVNFSLGKAGLSGKK